MNDQYLFQCPQWLDTLCLPLSPDSKPAAMPESTEAALPTFIPGGIPEEVLSGFRGEISYVVHVRVRVTNTLNDSKVWILPQNLLQQSSTYISKICEDKARKSNIGNLTPDITIQFEDSSIFELYVEWLHVKSYRIREHTVSWDLYANMIGKDIPWEYMACIWAWLLADKLGCRGFKNYAMRHTFMLYYEQNIPERIHHRAAKDVYGRAPTGCKLQSFFTDLLACKWRTHAIREPESWGSVFEKNPKVAATILSAIGGPRRPLDRKTLNLVDYLED